MPTFLKKNFEQNFFEVQNRLVDATTFDRMALRRVALGRIKLRYIGFKRIALGRMPLK